MPNPHPYRIGILADDLTSAADGVAPFVERGLSATVGRATLANGDDLFIAMKVGGSGDDDTLRRAVVRLRQNALATGHPIS